MSKDVKYIVPLKDDLDSAFMGYFGILNCKKDEFVISHELGHSMDTYLKPEYKQMQAEMKAAAEAGKPVPEFLANPIADNPEFQKEYFNERAMFIKAFPSFKEEYIDYFIFETDGQSDRGRKETVAETNAMNSQKPVPPEILAMRTQVLQQYFPRTIAVATFLFVRKIIFNTYKSDCFEYMYFRYRPRKLPYLRSCFWKNKHLAKRE